MENALISIIVPVYNVENYVKQCIDSIINQTYKNLEIILVDDGSPDNCGKICDDYEKIDSRIKVIHKINGGLSDARNTGMREANGEYLFFVDSDDYIHPTSIQKLLDVAGRTSADIVTADYISVRDENRVEITYDNADNFDLFDKSQAVDYYVKYDWGAWNKLYKREVHINTLFPKGKIHEDEAIMLQLLNNSSRIAHLHCKLYFYRQREGSITDIGYSIEKMDWFYSWKSNVDYIEKHFRTSFSKAIDKMLVTAFYNLDNLLRRNADNEKQYISDIVNTIIKYKKSILTNKYVKYTKKLRVLLIYNVKLIIYRKLYVRGK